MTRSPTSRAPAPKLGFLVFLNYSREEGDAGPARSLEDGIALFRHAEELGYASGWVRVHRHERTLSAPFAFLSAAARETSRISLGTGVIPIAGEDPGRLAEQAATADLLSGGRIRLGLSSGASPAATAIPRAHVWQRLTAVRSALDGEPLDLPPEVLNPGGPRQVLRALPTSPGLSRRLWYGAATRNSARAAGEHGFHLLLSTLSTETAAPTLGQAQAEQIRLFRDAWTAHQPDEAGQVVVTRSILPLLTPTDRRRYGPLVRRHGERLRPDGTARGSADPTQWSPLYAGGVDQIVTALTEDPSLALADTLLLAPAGPAGRDALHDLFAAVAQEVAPAAGWRLEPNR